jgi:hypothetical protein
VLNIRQEGVKMKKLGKSGSRTQDNGICGEAVSLYPKRTSHLGRVLSGRQVDKNKKPSYLANDVTVSVGACILRDAGRCGGTYSSAFPGGWR